jgi:hypothetical protein
MAAEALCPAGLSPLSAGAAVKVRVIVLVCLRVERGESSEERLASMTIFRSTSEVFRMSDPTKHTHTPKTKSSIDRSLF